MVIDLSPELEAALNQQAQQSGIAPETLVADTLKEKFLAGRQLVEPRDEWERRLFSAAVDCGVTVPGAALSSDGLYE